MADSIAYGGLYYPRIRLGIVTSSSTAAAPTVSAISPSIGDVNGGQSVTITVSDSTGATGAQVGGVSLTSFAIVNATTVSGVTGAHAATATANVTVTNGVGTGTLSSAFEFYDPSASMGPDLYCEGPDYTSGSWTGRVGGAGSLIESTTPPSVGATQNGLATVSFDGVDDQLHDGNASTLVSTNRGWIAVLVNVTSIATNVTTSGTLHLNDAIVSDSNGDFAISFASGGPDVQAWVDDGTQQLAAISGSPFATGAWKLVQMRWDGSNVKIRVGKNSWTSHAAGSTGTLANQFNVGRSYNAGKHFTGKLGMIAVGGKTNAIPSDADFDKHADFIVAKWNVSV